MHPNRRIGPTGQVRMRLARTFLYGEAFAPFRLELLDLSGALSGAQERKSIG